MWVSDCIIGRVDRGDQQAIKAYEARRKKQREKKRRCRERKAAAANAERNQTANRDAVRQIVRLQASPAMVAYGSRPALRWAVSKVRQSLPRSHQQAVDILCKLATEYGLRVICDQDLRGEFEGQKKPSLPPCGFSKEVIYRRHHLGSGTFGRIVSTDSGVEAASKILHSG